MLFPKGLNEYPSSIIAMGESGERLNLAFAFSLVAGVLILLNAIILLSMPMFYAMPTGYGGEPEYCGHMMCWMRPYFWFGYWAWIYIAIGIISGIVVLISSLMLRSRHEEKTLWGTLIVVFSVLSILSGGGFFLGLVFGVLGGILALTES